MEKILSSNERERRAEEIYARRQNLRERTKRATVNVSEQKNFKLLKRVVLQIIICALIYFIFYLINTTNYSFSKVTLEKTNNLLSADTDFIGIYNNLLGGVKGYFETLNSEKEAKEENKIENNIENVQQEEKGEKNSQEQKDNNEVSIIQDTDQESEKTGEENLKDVHISETDRIKENYSFALPINRKNYIRIWRERKYFKCSVYIS